MKFVNSGFRHYFFLHEAVSAIINKMILLKPPVVSTIDYIFAGSIFGTSRWKMPSAIKYADPEIINGMK